MPDELIDKALDTVRVAQQYLDRRTASSQSAEERAYLDEWRRTLEPVANQLAITYVVIAPFEPRRRYLSEQFDLTRRHIEDLHEYYDLPSVDVVLRTLHQQVAMIAGPHGPGGGRPGGPTFPGTI